MILEVADIRIQPSAQAEFEKAVYHGLDSVLSLAKGFQSYEVRHCVEKPERYLLLIKWDTLEDHTVNFRLSPAHAAWREIVGGFFAQPPYVEHFKVVQTPQSE